MNVKADVMANVVREECPHSLLGWHSHQYQSYLSQKKVLKTYAAGDIETQLFQLLLQTVLGDFMQFVKREECTFATHGDA